MCDDDALGQENISTKMMASPDIDPTSDEIRKIYYVKMVECECEYISSGRLVYGIWN